MRLLTRRVVDELLQVEKRRGKLVGVEDERAKFRFKNRLRIQAKGRVLGVLWIAEGTFSRYRYLRRLSRGSRSCSAGITFTNSNF